MKKITMFILSSCPYCKQALRLTEALRKENSYKEVEIEIIDESLHPDIANKYDYYYVPTYYVGGKKLHEGAASPKIVKHVFDAALEKE